MALLQFLRAESWWGKWLRAVSDGTPLLLSLTINLNFSPGEGVTCWQYVCKAYCPSTGETLYSDIVKLRVAKATTNECSFPKFKIALVIISVFFPPSLLRNYLISEY